MTFFFGDTMLEPARLEVVRHGARVALEPQAFDVLVYLVQHRDRVVPKEELMDEIWGGRFVTEASVTSRIKQARRALGDDGQSQSCIRTYHGRGYRFVADVTVADAPPDPEVQTSSEVVDETVRPPVLNFGGTGRPRRFQVSGQGPPDLLLLPASPSLDRDWEQSERAGLLEGLGAMARVVRYEAAGPSTPDGQGEPELVELLEAAASERPVLLAEDSGAALAISFASRHPDRVAGLVLFGAALADEPSAAGGTAELLRSVTAPTLVMHRSDDAVVPIAHGRTLAAQIPNAEFVAVPGDGHWAHPDSSRILTRVGEFVREVTEGYVATRQLNALVGLDRGDVTSLVSVLLQLGGTLRQGPEKSVIVSFDGPANALNALGSRRARGLRSEVGIGLAIDEIPRDSLLVSGHGVDVARLFAQHAEPGEVLLPNVIKHLLAGSGLKVETLTPLDLPHVGLHPVHRWLPSG